MGADIVGIAIGLGLIITVAVVGVLILSVYRRRLSRPGESAATFSLSDLRAMRDRGAISDEEYERARARMVERYNQARAAESATKDGEPPLESKRM